MSETDLPRRTFLRAATVATALSYSRVMGANDKIRLGVIGIGDRGSSDMGNFLRNPDVQVVALCDLYDAHLDRAKQRAADAKTFSDHRALLDSKDIDIVQITVPDHWHVPIAIDVLNSGRDLYCEKPLSLTPEEGPLVVKAARENKRICQVGMQQRSGAHYLQAKAEYFDTGKIGKVTLSRTWWHGNSYHLRKAPDSLKQLPAGLDWNRFLGRLKWRDWDPQQYYNWRAYLDFGGGQVTDLFTHWIDVVHMFTGKDIPKSAVAAGGVYQYKDGRTAPDTINVLLEYPGEMTATFEATLVPGATGAAQQFCGTNGRLDIDRSGYTWTPVGRGAQPVTVRGNGNNLDFEHISNFLECVKSRKLPNGDVLIGHRSAQASHLGNIAYVQKRRIDFDPVREEILPL
jgi:predicted dehydrogenase